MRLFVAGAMYLASGALFNTIETVAGENPLCDATSLIVTAWFFSLERFTRRAPWWPTSSRQNHSIANTVGTRRLLLRRYLKRKWLPEPTRLPNAENDSRDHPYSTQNLRRTGKAEP